MNFVNSMVWQDHTSVSTPRRLVATVQDAEIYELETPYGTIYELIRPELCHFARLEDAEAAAGRAGGHLFLTPDQIALVARMDEAGTVRYGTCWGIEGEIPFDCMLFDVMLTGNPLVYDVHDANFETALVAFSGEISTRRSDATGRKQPTRDADYEATEGAG